MSKTDPANYPECLSNRENEGEARTRRVEHLGDLRARAKQARATRGPSRIHYTLFMMGLSRDDLCTLGIQNSTIQKHCPQFKGDETKHFSLSNTLKDHAKCKPNQTSQTSRKRRRF